MATSDKNTAHKSVIGFCAGLRMAPVQNYRQMLLANTRMFLEHSCYTCHHRQSKFMGNDTCIGFEYFHKYNERLSGQGFDTLTELLCETFKINCSLIEKLFLCCV